MRFLLTLWAFFAVVAGAIVLVSSAYSSVDGYQYGRLAMLAGTSRPPGALMRPFKGRDLGQVVRGAARGALARPALTRGLGIRVSDTGVAPASAGGSPVPATALKKSSPSAACPPGQPPPTTQPLRMSRHSGESG